MMTTMRGSNETTEGACLRLTKGILEDLSQNNIVMGCCPFAVHCRKDLYPLLHYISTVVVASESCLMVETLLLERVNFAVEWSASALVSVENASVHELFNGNIAHHNELRHD